MRDGCSVFPGKFSVSTWQGADIVDIPPFDGSRDYLQGLRAVGEALKDPGRSLAVLRFPNHGIAGRHTCDVYAACAEAWLEISATAAHVVRVSMSYGGDDAFAGIALCQHTVLIERSAVLGTGALSLPGIASLLVRRSDHLPDTAALTAREMIDKGFADAAFAEGDGVMEATIKNGLRRRAGLAGINRAIAVFRKYPVAAGLHHNRVAAAA